MNTIRVLLVGIGGYGAGYLDAMLDHADEMGLELAGAVDPAPRGCSRLAELEERVGTVHDTLDAFYERGGADLAVISAPIHLHAPLTIKALERGSHVLCEKPVAGAVQDALAMAAAAKEHERTLAIGYQWSFSETIQAIRRDVVAGRFGVPLQMKTLAFWPRPASYYGRTSWAGALRAPDGSWVLDSPVNNATAHYLHNALFVLGSDGGRPLSVEAELYRANEIESFDTAALRVETACGAEVLFYTAHPVPSRVGPVIHYRFSEADVYCTDPGHFYARLPDGAIEDYGSPGFHHRGKLERMAKRLRENDPPACSVDEATYQLLVTCGAHESAEIVSFPTDVVRRWELPAGMIGPSPDTLTWVAGLQDAFTQAFEQGALPAELGSLAWARGGTPIDLEGYERFPSGTS
ncbi:MAG: Gfo/Idh/MocA family protein [Spirochaetota bacterium]